MSNADFKLNNTAPIAAAIPATKRRGAPPTVIAATFNLKSFKFLPILLNPLPKRSNVPLKPPSIILKAPFAPLTANVPALLIPSNTNFKLSLPAVNALAPNDMAALLTLATATVAAVTSGATLNAANIPNNASKVFVPGFSVSPKIVSLTN